ncbi:CBS domain-containing protein [Candidatus Woesearchaeota archaeon]|nr:CBS domain-containing protein [Candidatus Woesearchaeota archaeon]
MAYELKDIKDIRKKFGLTQIDLAKKSGVSQSLIAKIEAGRLDPTYNKAKKIFEALDELTQTKEIKAEEIMTHKVVSVGRESGVHEIIKKMRKYAISQMPVIEGDKILGVLSEAIVLDALMKGKKEIKAKEIMQDAPPTIGKNASITIVSSLLKFYPMVIVVEQGKILGVITKSDIIRKVYKS